MKVGQLRQLIREEIQSVMKEQGTDILSFLKSNEQELRSKLAKKFRYDEFHVTHFLFIYKKPGLIS
jgi:hypothetical protein